MTVSSINASTIAVAPGVPLSISANTGTTYTLALTDAYKLLTFNNASAQTISVPTNASAPFPIGTQINVAWITGAGQQTFVATTPLTTTILSTGGTSTSPKLRAVNSLATLAKIAVDTWLVVGDVS